LDLHNWSVWFSFVAFLHSHIKSWSRKYATYGFYTAPEAGIGHIAIPIPVAEFEDLVFIFDVTPVFAKYMGKKKNWAGGHHGAQSFFFVFTTKSKMAL
jgi:hypothetical protein